MKSFPAQPEPTTQFWAVTDVGHVRQANQDAFLIDEGAGVAIVADGVGGRHRGDVAAELACRVVREHLIRVKIRAQRFKTNGNTANRDAVKQSLREAVQLASAQIFEIGHHIRSGKGMSCTIEVALVIGTTIFLAHVGDSRTYLIRGRQAYLVTEDHSVVQEKVRKGHLTTEQARTAKGKNVITRAVGIMPSVQVDTLSIVLEPGDAILMCSDGLTRHIRCEELTRALPHFSHAAVEQLVALANVRGGLDNITALLVAVSEPFDSSTPLPIEQEEKLRSFPVLESCTHLELKSVSQLLTLARVKPGKLVFKEAQRSEHLFLLLEGQVVLTQEGRQISTVNPGDIFGEVELLEQTRRITSALATEPCTLLMMSRHRLDQLCSEPSPLAQKISKALHLGALKRLRDITSAR